MICTELNMFHRLPPDAEVSTLDVIEEAIAIPTAAVLAMVVPAVSLSCAMQNLSCSFQKSISQESQRDEAQMAQFLMWHLHSLPSKKANSVHAVHWLSEEQVRQFGTSQG